MLWPLFAQSWGVRKIRVATERVGSKGRRRSGWSALRADQQARFSLCQLQSRPPRHHLSLPPTDIAITKLHRPSPPVFAIIMSLTSAPAWRVVWLCLLCVRHRPCWMFGHSSPPSFFTVLPCGEHSSVEVLFVLGVRMSIASAYTCEMVVSRHIILSLQCRHYVPPIRGDVRSWFQWSDCCNLLGTGH